MSEIRPIDCALYDHLEVACMFEYELDVWQKNGAVVVGTAVTTRIAGGAEFLVLKAGEGTVEVPMHEIEEVSVRTPNAMFFELKF